MKKKYYILTLAAFAIFLIFRYLLPLVFPFVLALCFARISLPGIRYLHERCRWNYKLSVTLVVLAMYAVIAAFVLYIGCSALQQAGDMLRRLPVYRQYLWNVTDKVCCGVDNAFDLAEGESMRFMESQSDSLFCWARSDLLPGLTKYACVTVQSVCGVLIAAFMCILATFLILYEKDFPGGNGRVKKFLKNLEVAGFAYIKSQALILFMIAVVFSVGFMIMGNSYGILLGILLSIVDAIPAVGSGVVLIPWTLIELGLGDYKNAAILATLFVLVTFIREILEPKLFGQVSGIKPLYFLMAVYAGNKLFGVSGVILGPIALIILNALKSVL